MKKKILIILIVLISVVIFIGGSYIRQKLAEKETPETKTTPCISLNQGCPNPPLNCCQGSYCNSNAAKCEQIPGWAPSDLGLAITSDGKTAYIPFSLDDALLVVDLPTFTVTDSIDVSAAGNMLQSQSAVVTPDGKKLFVSNYGTKNVMAVNTENKRIEKVFPINPLSAVTIAVSKDGSKVYMPSAEDGGLDVINTSDNSYRHISIPGIIFGPVVPSSNNPDLLYVAGMFVKPPGIFQSYFYIFNVSNNTVVRSSRLADEVLPPHIQARRLIINSDETTAYFGWMEIKGDMRGVGNFIVFNLNTFQVLTSLPVENGVSDFTLNEEADKAYIIGFWTGGGAPQKLPIQEYDVPTKKIVRQIMTSPSSDQRAIVIDPANTNYLYMTEGDFNLIRKVDITTGKEIARLQFNKADIQPFAIIRGDNMGYIVGRSSRKVYKLDLGSGQLTGSISLPEGASQAGGYYQDKLYFYGERHIYSINPSNSSLIKKFNIGMDINPITLTFFNDKMAVIDYETTQIARRLLVFDAKTMSILKSIKLPHEPHGDKVIVSPDSSKFYISRGSMTGTTVVTVFDASTLEIINTIEIPYLQQRRGTSYFPEADFDEVGRILYLTGGASVYKIDMDTDKLISSLDLIDAYGGPSGIRWSPTAICGVALSPSKEKLFAFSADAHSLFTYNLTKPSLATKIIDLGGYSRDCDAAMSPDRQYFYTANSQSDSITMVDLTSGDVVRIIRLE